jgi:hypothetical protein
MTNQKEQASEAMKSTVGGGGYAQTLRQRLADNPEYRTPAEFAATFHDALVGFGQALPKAEQEARFERLADLRELGVVTAAAGQELARHYMVLDGLATRYALAVQRINPETASARDLEKAARHVELALKAGKAARQTLAASVMLAQDLRVLGLGRDLAEVGEG